MDDFKTVEGEIKPTDPLIRKQIEGVAEMRTSLLASAGNPLQAMRQITSMRVYHQLTRIVRYTELMDKVESKLYESIENQVDNADTADPATWLTLLHIQSRLQDNMIKSHKLLEPYLSADANIELELSNASDDDTQLSILDRTSRDNIRRAAQQLLLMMDSGDSDDGLG